MEAEPHGPGCQCPQLLAEAARLAHELQALRVRQVTGELTHAEVESELTRIGQDIPRMLELLHDTLRTQLSLAFPLLYAQWRQVYGPHRNQE